MKSDEIKPGTKIVLTNPTFPDKGTVWTVDRINGAQVIISREGVLGPGFCWIDNLQPLNQENFAVGDEVMRINDRYGQLKVGGTFIIEDINGRLASDGVIHGDYWHSFENLHILKKAPKVAPEGKPEEDPLFEVETVMRQSMKLYTDKDGDDLTLDRDGDEFELTAVDNFIYIDKDGLVTLRDNLTRIIDHLEAQPST